MRVLVVTTIMSVLVTACASTTGTEPESENPSTSRDSTTAAARASTTTTMQSTTTSVSMTMDSHGDQAGEAAPTTTVTGGIRVIEVVMTEMDFIPQRFEVAAGETVEFLVTNEGAIAHEFRLSNPHRIEEHMAGHGDGAGHGESGGHHEDADVVLELDAGASGSVAVTFPDDTSLFTEVACLLPGHYEAGMHAQIFYHG